MKANIKFKNADAILGFVEDTNLEYYGLCKWEKENCIWAVNENNELVCIVKNIDFVQTLDNRLLEIQNRPELYPKVIIRYPKDNSRL
jgi:hypothetical protein